MEQIEYVTRTEVVSATKITQSIVDGYEIEGEPLQVGDYLIFVNGGVGVFDGEEFEKRYRVNTKDDWEDDIDGNHGFDWALMQMMNGWKVRHQDWPNGQCAYYDPSKDDFYEGRGNYRAVWEITSDVLLTRDGWEVLIEE